MCLKVRNNMACATISVAAWGVLFATTAALAQPRQDADQPPQPPQPAPGQPVARTQPVRRMVWDRARVAIDLGRREAMAQKAVDRLEALARATPLDPQVGPALERARRELDQIREAVKEARRTMASDVVLEKAAYLGVASTSATPVLRKHLKLPDGVGLVVDFVEPASPAADAGIQPHDVAFQLNDQILVNPEQLAVLVRTFEPDTAITIKLFRRGKTIPVPVTLVERDVRPLSEVRFAAAAAGANALDGQTFRFAAHAGDPLVPFAVDTKDDPPLRPGDLVRVAVYDLGGPGAQTVALTYVDRDGRISLPQLKTPVRVEGTSGRTCVDIVRDAYRTAGLLEHPHVSVQLMKPAAKASGEKD
jgi:hypothetical protein